MYVSLSVLCVSYMPPMTFREFSVAFLKKKHSGGVSEDSTVVMKPAARLQGRERYIRGNIERDPNTKRVQSEDCGDKHTEHQRLCVFSMDCVEAFKE